VAVGLEPVADVRCHCEQRHEIVAEPSPQVLVCRQGAAMGQGGIDDVDELEETFQPGMD
jgi:hypothetical protein